MRVSLGAHGGVRNTHHVQQLNRTLPGGVVVILVVVGLKGLNDLVTHGVNGGQSA